MLCSRGMKRKTPLPPKPVRSPQIPVTVEMLNEMEDRLSHKMDAGIHLIRSDMSEFKSMMRSEMSGFKSEMRSEMSEFKSVIRSEMSGFKSEIGSEMSGMKSDISVIKSELSGIKSELHRVALLVEEQNARNRFVLDGYAQLYELIERKLG